MSLTDAQLYCRGRYKALTPEALGRLRKIRESFIVSQPLDNGHTIIQRNAVWAASLFRQRTQIYPLVMLESCTQHDLFPRSIAEFQQLTEVELDVLATAYHRWTGNDPLFEDSETATFGFSDHPCMWKVEEWMSDAVIGMLSSDSERLEHKRMCFGHYIGVIIYETTPTWWIHKITAQLERVFAQMHAEGIFKARDAVEIGGVWVHVPPPGPPPPASGTGSGSGM
jgi:hypothetical protein